MAGLFKTVGSVLNTVTTLVEAVDNTVSNTATILDKGFVGINIPLDNMLEDLKCDSIVDNANRRVRIAHATAEAESIEESLNQPSKPKRRTTKAKA